MNAKLVTKIFHSPKKAEEDETDKELNPRSRTRRRLGGQLPPEELKKLTLKYVLQGGRIRSTQVGNPISQHQRRNVFRQTQTEQASDK
jgi:hypothetical protein